jgi:flagellar basal-body rod protein FlgG
MSVRPFHAASFSILLFAACQSPGGAAGDSTTRTREVHIAELDHEVRHLRSSIQVLTGMVTDLLGKTRITTETATEPPGRIEMNAHLARLNERLAALTTQLASGPGSGSAGGAPANATATHGSRAGLPPDDEAVILALQRAILVVEQQRSLHIENLANVNTPGYRHRTLRLTTTMQPGTGLELPESRGVQLTCTTGALEITERSLDVAIDGDGYFAVTRADGSTAYTRNGGIHINASGTMVLGDGSLLTPHIHVPDDTLDISIDPEGRVSVRTAGAPDTSTQLGRIQLHRFPNASALEPVGDNLLQPSANTGAVLTANPGEGGVGLLKQGFIERSNVQMLNELVNIQVIERQLTTLRRTLAGYGVFAY